MTSNKEQTGLQRGIIISSTVITIVVVAAAYLLHRAQNKRVTKLIEKIEVIQANQDNAFAQLDSSLFNKQINELQANRLKLQEERFKLEVGKQKQELFWHIVGVLGIGTVAGFFAFLFFVPNEVRQRTRDEIDLQIAPLVNDQKEILKRVLHKYGEEDRLERSKKIGVKGKLNSTITDSILRRQYGLTIIEDEQELSTCDVIIISGEDVKLKALDLRKEKLDTPDDINKYIYIDKKLPDNWKNVLDEIQRNPTTCYLYYNTTGKHFPSQLITDEKVKARINFATNVSQIYGNLLNLMKYQDKLSK